jgi:hypothetical protein
MARETMPRRASSDHISVHGALQKFSKTRPRAPLMVPPPFPQVFCGYTASRQQVWHASVSAGALIVSMDELVQKVVTSAVGGITEFVKYQEYRGPRPQVPVTADPMLWWKHAVNAVLREYKKLSVGPTVLPPRLEERRAMRTRYVELYTKIHNGGGLTKSKKSVR